MRYVRRTTLAIVFVALAMFAASAQSGKYTNDPNSQITGGPKHSTTSKNPNDAVNANWGSKVDQSDRQFLEDAAQGGLAEVQLGQLAQEKASDPAVKQFGEQMVKDHTSANEQLKSLAAAKGVRLPTTLKPEDQQKKDELSKASGKQFDTRYTQAMVQDHQKDVQDFQKESANAKDNDVKKFASGTLPILQAHLQKAQQLQKQAASK